MKNFYSKDDYSIEDAYSLITNEVEESIYLDFKEASALDMSDGKKKDIAKDVSSFANSDGGIIVYGIREADHKASEITFIDGNKYTKEWLEQLINSTIQRHIPDLKIFPIRENGDIEKTIYIVKIPKSVEAPHISRDKRFYKRFNFESIMMEEYEIRQLYGRKVKSKLCIESWSTQELKNEENFEVIQYEIQLLNVGDIVENEYKVNFHITHKEGVVYSWNRELTNYSSTRMDDSIIKLSAVGIAPIFPEELFTAMRFHIKIPKNRGINYLSDCKIRIHLFYANGEDTIETDFSNFLDDINI